jgi:sugar phosphate isomerase/epimerase
MGPITIVDFSCAWVMKDVFQINRSKPGWMSREDVLKFYSELRAEGVELMDEYWRDCTPQYLRNLTNDLGLPITCYVIFVDLALPEKERQAEIDAGRRLLDRTAAIGASRAMIVPAVFKHDLSYSDQRSWVVEGIRVLAEYAENLKLMLLAENIDYPPVRPLMGRGTQCREICEQVDSPAFRLIYDSGCSLSVSEDPIETLKIMAPYLYHVHVKNSRRLGPQEQTERFIKSDSGETFVSTQLGAGLVDIGQVVRELDKVGYSGPILLEYNGEDPLKVLPEDVAFLKGLRGNGTPEHAEARAHMEGPGEPGMLVT